MTEKQADQIIRCVKECWWRLMVFFAVELFFVALVTYGWPQGDWSMGWGAIGAVGTMVTGGAALFIGWQQQGWLKKSRESDYFKLITKLKETLGEVEMILRIKNYNETLDEYIAIATHYFPRTHTKLKEIYEGPLASLLSVQILEDIQILINTGDFLGSGREYQNETHKMLDEALEKSLLHNSRQALGRVIEFLNAGNR